MKALADRYLAKFISRKLGIVILATVLLCEGLITADHWSVITSLWVGGQTLIDRAAKLKAAR